MNEPTTETTQAHLRRAPRLPVFLVLGAVLGVIAALVLTAVGQLDPKVGFGATFGYLCLWCIPLGILVGALVAIVIDQVSRRRARLVSVERAMVEGDESDPADDDRG
ncbi:potassium transporter Trk [Pseudolysinimonas sp.]|uniref:potassium transporter Trk n=1 Tax=Pseudolysinimonas sp. TaxID=2680009 RepID=UPI003F7D7CF8